MQTMLCRWCRLRGSSFRTLIRNFFFPEILKQVQIMLLTLGKIDFLHTIRAGFARYLTGVKYFILRFGLQIFGENRKRIDSNELWVSLQRKRTKCFRKKTSSECVIMCVTALIVAFARYFLSEILRSHISYAHRCLNTSFEIVVLNNN